MSTEDMRLFVAVNRAQKCRAMVRDYDENPHPDPVKQAAQRQAWVDALAVYEDIMREHGVQVDA